LLDSLARGLTIETLGRGEVFEELDGVEIRVNAEVLRKITQHCSQAIRRAENVHAIPSHRAARRLGDRSENAHKRRFARAIGPEQAKDSWPHFQGEILQAPNLAGVKFTDALKREFHVLWHPTIPSQAAPPHKLNLP